MRILLYHGVRPSADTTSPDIRKKHVPESVFRRQMKFIRRWYAPISLSDLLALLRDGRPLPKNGICITFDDGYENNATTAAPILKEMGIPATFFVTTGFLDGTTRLWVDRFETAFSKQPRTETDNVVRSRLKKLSPTEREQEIQQLEQEAGTAQFIHPLHQPMTWKQVRDLRAQGFEIGAHTVTHPILATLTPEEQQTEVLTSKQRIETETQKPCLLFAHPNGQPGDWNAETLRIVRAYFETCLTTIDGPIRLGDDPFMLNRFTVDTGSDLAKFILTVTGIRSTIAGIRHKIRL